MRGRRSTSLHCMKVEYIGCCFRIELEIYQRHLSLRKYRIAPGDELFTLKRRLLRQIRSRVVLKRTRFPAIERLL
jgi:hypothetical protein